MVLPPLPYTADVLDRLIVQYNNDVWPMHLLAYAMALTMLWSAGRQSPSSGRLTLGGLAVFWLWTGATFHWHYLADLNWAAPGFAGLFALQGGLLAINAALRRKLDVGWRVDAPSVLGLFSIALALVIHPAFRLAAGHAVTEIPAFALTPLSCCVFTVGLLCLTRGGVLHLLILPSVWAIYEAWQAWTLGTVVGYVALPLAAAAIALEVGRKRRSGAGES